MSSLADKLDKRLDEIDATRVYRIRPVTIDGTKYQCGESDEGVEKILHFRGTGKVINFQEVLVEYGRYWEEWFDLLLETGKKNGQLIWLSEWIIQRNYQIRFQAGDITVRNKFKS